MSFRTNAFTNLSNLSLSLRTSYLIVRKKFAPTKSSLSAFLLPIFQAFSSAPQVRKCWKTSQWARTG